MSKSGKLRVGVDEHKSREDNGVLVMACDAGKAKQDSALQVRRFGRLNGRIQMADAMPDDILDAIES